MHLKKLSLLLLVIALPLIHSGCIASHLIQGVSELGYSEGDRMGLLGKAAKILHRGLTRDRAIIAPELLYIENRVELEEKLRNLLRNKRFVDMSLDSTDFGEGAMTAESHGYARVLTSPTFTVEEYRITEHWVFVMNEGWRLSDFILVPNQSGVSTRGPLGL